MADINQVQLPDGSQYNIQDSTSGYATENYVQTQIGAITKATIGLGNVDNTSDANKPVSTAQQTALDGKVNTSMVAHVQTTLTADMRYVVGDEFIYQGNLYKATAIIPNGDAITIGTNASLADDISTQIGNANTAIGTLNTTVAGKAGKSDLTSISETGSTASQAISAGTYFYLDGTLVRAKTAIASGATFTLNTNYEVVSAGALNSRGIKLLWSNPNPSAEFPAQTITLSSSDYDLLLFTTSNASRVVLKGENCTLGRGDTVSSGTNLSAYSREIIYQNATTYSAGDGYYQVQGSTRYVYNLGMRPSAIYGIKL